MASKEVTTEQLAEAARRLAEINAEYAERFAALVCVLARDQVALCDLVMPADEREAVMVRGARQRAERILAGLGGDQNAH